MSRDAVVRTANVGTVGKNGLTQGKTSTQKNNLLLQQGKTLIQVISLAIKLVFKVALEATSLLRDHIVYAYVSFYWQENKACEIWEMQHLLNVFYASLTR